MARVTRRPLAALDLLDLWGLIAEESPDDANRRIDRLSEQFDLLAEAPATGLEREELSPGLRSWAYGRHVIFYWPIEDGIDVVRVMQTQQDVPPLVLAGGK